MLSLRCKNTTQGGSEREKPEDEIFRAPTGHYAGDEVTGAMTGTAITDVRPLRDGLMWVDFKSGSRVLLNLKPCFETMRFRALAAPGVWESARANGGFVKWYSGETPVAELSYEELFSVVAGE